MSLPLEKADAFSRDFALQALYYVRAAGADVARRFQVALDSQLRLLCAQPEIDRLRHFKHPKLQGLRSFPLERPFQAILMFYRVGGGTVQAVRLMDGARDLARRLAEPPG
jgi:plasmid stabilization system protein ParE